MSAGSSCSRPGNPACASPTICGSDGLCGYPLNFGCSNATATYACAKPYVCDDITNPRQPICANQLPATIITAQQQLPITPSVQQTPVQPSASPPNNSGNTMWLIIGIIFMFILMASIGVWIYMEVSGHKISPAKLTEELNDVNR